MTHGILNKTNGIKWKVKHLFLFLILIKQHFKNMSNNLESETLFTVK